MKQAAADRPGWAAQRWHRLACRVRADLRLVLHPRTLLRSAGVRFGLIYAGLFALSALALTGFLWWSTAGLLDRQTDTAINADAQGLVERFLDGPGALV
jgi:hypothetical protein